MHIHCTNCVPIPHRSASFPRLARLLLALLFLTIVSVAARFNLHGCAVPYLLVVGKFVSICVLQVFAALILLQMLLGLCQTAAVNARLLACGFRLLGIADAPVCVAMLVSALIIENCVCALRSIVLDSQHCSKLASRSFGSTFIPTVLLAIGCEAIVAHGCSTLMQFVVVSWHVFGWITHGTCALRQHSGCLFISIVC